MTIRQDITSLILMRKRTAAEVREALPNLGYKQVSNALNQLTREGRISRAGRIYYIPLPPINGEITAELGSTNSPTSLAQALLTEVAKLVKENRELKEDCKKLLREHEIMHQRISELSLRHINGR